MFDVGTRPQQHVQSQDVATTTPLRDEPPEKKQRTVLVGRPGAHHIVNTSVKLKHDEKRAFQTRLLKEALDAKAAAKALGPSPSTRGMLDGLGHQPAQPRQRLFGEPLVWKGSASQPPKDCQQRQPVAPWCGRAPPKDWAGLFGEMTYPGLGWRPLAADENVCACCGDSFDDTWTAEEWAAYRTTVMDSWQRQGLTPYSKRQVWHHPPLCYALKRRSKP